MSSALKIICCTAATTVVVGIGSQTTRVSQVNQSFVSAPGAAAAITLAAFEPDPSTPPVVTQGSGTR